MANVRPKMEQKVLSEERIDYLKNDYERGFINYCGFKAETAQWGAFQSKLEITRNHRQQDGFIHAGVMATMADHTAGYTIAPEIAGVGGKVDPLTDEGKGELSLTFQAATAFIDSTGYCLFIAFPILDIADGWAGMTETVAGVTGMKVTGDDVVPLGKEILKMERLFNERAGFTAEHDRPPEFMRYEKLPPHDEVWTVTDEELDKVYDWVHDE